MGVSSNLEVFLSEKHLNNTKDREEFIITTEQSNHDDDLTIKTKQQTVQVQEQQQNNVPLLVLLPSAAPSPDLGLKIKIPPYNVEEEEETEKQGSSSSSSSDDGFKTPTGPEHRIPLMLECPPAPKKPKTTPSSTAKRRRSRPALIDFSHQELFVDDSLFPSTPSVVDRCSAKNKNSKKVKVKLFTDDDEEEPPQ